MMKKLAFTLACAVALMTIAPLPASGNLDAAPAAAMRVAVATTTSMTLPAAADVSVVSSNITELTPLAMSQVRGAGFWNWVKNTTTKLAKWAYNNQGLLVQLWNAIFNTNSSGTHGTSPAPGMSQTDYISRTEDINEIYDTNGVLVSTDVSSSEQVDYTEYTPDAT